MIFSKYTKMKRVMPGSFQELLQDKTKIAKMYYLNQIGLTEHSKGVVSLYFTNQTLV